MAKDFLFAVNAEQIFSPTDENGHELEDERVRVHLSTIVTKNEYIWILQRTKQGLLKVKIPHKIGRPKKEKQKEAHPDVIKIEEYEDGQPEPQ